VSKPKFTPGPWFVFDRRDIERGFWVGPEEFTTIAEVRHGADDEEYGGDESLIANASLIAAATDMYFLLEMAKCPCCDGSGAAGDNHGGVTQCPWCYERDATLAKARGEP
jgi:hypothetical protein